MASRSLKRWETERSAALDRLQFAHITMTGGLRGRPRDVTELNHALFLRLASEIQGFCRDLHDESIEGLCTPACIPSSEILRAFRTACTTGRKLDAGNAGPGNIGSDWALLGLTLWPDLKARYPGIKGSSDWNSALEWLNLARNGIAHNDSVKIQQAHDQRPLTLRTWKSVRGKLNRFARGLDTVTKAYLISATETAPW